MGNTLYFLAFRSPMVMEFWIHFVQKLIACFLLLSWVQLLCAGKELEKLAQGAGFSNAKHYEIAGGLMGNLVSTR